MNTPRILDDAALLNLSQDGVQLIEASAGTGKTHTISNIYLKLLVQGGLRVDQILLLTFTRAATDELRGRIRARLRQARAMLEHAEQTTTDSFLAAWRDELDSTARDQARKCLQLALISMDEAAIFTLNGWCQRVLSDFAFYSGEDFEQELLEDDGPLWDAALKDWWRQNLYPDDLRSQLIQQAWPDVAALSAVQKTLRKPMVTLAAGQTGDNLDDLPLEWTRLCTQHAVLQARWQQRGVAWCAVLLNKDTRFLSDCRVIYKAFDEQVFDGYFQDDFPGDLTNDRLIKVNEENLNKALLKNKKQYLPVDLLTDWVQPWQAFYEQVQAIRARIKHTALHEANQAAQMQVAAVKRRSGQMAYDDQIQRLQQVVVADNDNTQKLLEALRQRYPVAMVDEFQDTDAAQYAILQRIYHGQDQTGLIMIGDPKQAIYSFRGGDIFTYLRARNDAAVRWTLNTNWRATPELVAASNHLFGIRPQAFVYEGIEAEAVQAADQNPRRLLRAGQPEAAMTVWQLPMDQGQAKAFNKETASALVHAAVADEISRLLNAAQDGTLTLGGRPLQAADIAVLVRTHYEAEAVQQALRQRGVDAVQSATGNVFDSAEAADLYRLLAAVVAPEKTDLARLALGVDLLGKSPGEIYRIQHDETQWQTWLEDLQGLHENWQKKGFMAMLQQLLRLPVVTAGLAQQAAAERSLTNLLHLAELLQQQARQLSGMEALLVWLQRQRQASEQSGDEQQLRLESDRLCVQLVTIHKAKGLEYPVVFVPYLWYATPIKNKALVCHTAEANAYRLHLQASGTAHAQADRERLAEDVRLLYVALTRASSKLYLVWGNAGDAAGKSALAWLLHAQGTSATDLEQKTLQTFGGKTALSASAWQGEQALPPEVLEHAPLPASEQPVQRKEHSEHLQPLAEPAHWPALHHKEWRQGSFSQLTRTLHPAGSHPTAPEDSSDTEPMFLLPAGARMGVFLHALLERLDFQDPAREHSIQAFIEQQAVRYGLPQLDAGVIVQGMEQAVRCPLDDSGWCLHKLSRQDRLDELAFHFAVTQGSMGALRSCLQAPASMPLRPPLQARQFVGLMTGFIDLVYRRQGRYYLVDYKSNRLGYQLQDYARAALDSVIHARYYDLQYLIYTVALHRHLRRCLPDYDYDRHMGGVYYLFLRGMRPEHGPTHGVYFIKPDKTVIEQLDTTVFGGGL